MSSESIGDKVGGVVDKFGSQIRQGLEKAGQVIDEKTGGKYSDQIDTGVDKAGDALDGLDGQDDDIPNRDASESTPPSAPADVPADPTDSTRGPQQHDPRE